MAPEPKAVFVGWDRRETEAYEVCRYSLLRRSSVPLSVVPLKQAELAARGLYRRTPDVRASTEFTFTRFFVPYLMGYGGWAVYCDCDFLWVDDIARLFDLADERYAVQVVQHDYRPRKTLKMDGRIQYPYPRKNWSSLILWNCGHTRNHALDLDTLNSASASYLHRFQWLDDSEIGSLSHVWNWLSGWYTESAGERPRAIHYTEGGPWFENCRDADYAAAWLAERAEIEADRRARTERLQRAETRRPSAPPRPGDGEQT